MSEELLASIATGVTEVLKNQAVHSKLLGRIHAACTEADDDGAQSPLMDRLGDLITASNSMTAVLENLLEAVRDQPETMRDMVREELAAAVAMRSASK